MCFVFFLAELFEHCFFFFFLFDFFDFVNADVEFRFGSDRACDKALRLFFHFFFVAVAALLFSIALMIACTTMPRIRAVAMEVMVMVLSTVPLSVR